MPAMRGEALVPAARSEALVPAARGEALVPAMPPERPLDMPTQRLRRYDTSKRHQAARWPGAWRAWLARLVVFGGGLAVTAYGGWQMWKVIDVGGVIDGEIVINAEPTADDTPGGPRSGDSRPTGTTPPPTITQD